VQRPGIGPRFFVNARLGRGTDFPFPGNFCEFQPRLFLSWPFRGGQSAGLFHPPLPTPPSPRTVQWATCWKPLTGNKPSTAPAFVAPLAVWAAGNANLRFSATTLFLQPVPRRRGMNGPVATLTTPVCPLSSCEGLNRKIVKFSRVNC